jgi:hypothetical protein
MVFFSKYVTVLLSKTCTIIFSEFSSSAVPVKLAASEARTATALMCK